MSTLSSLKILMLVNDLVGPQNACIGFGQHLQKRGHRVYFCLTREFVTKFAGYGFAEENLLLLTTNNQESANDEKESTSTLKKYVDMILSYGFVSPLSPLEKVKQIAKVNMIQTTYEDQIKQFDQQLKQYLETLRPDLIVYDGEIIPPSILFWKHCPWIYLFCSNPIGLFDSDRLPPFLSDFPTDGDPESWLEFRSVLEEYYFRLIREMQIKVNVDLGYPSTIPDKYQPPRFFIHSPYGNLYQYPLEMDYDSHIEIPHNCHRVDAFCREENDKDLANLQRIPDKFRIQPRPDGRKLIYLSLGSMGSCNLELMQRLITILSRTEHLYLVSKGVLGDQLKLPDNMFGEKFLPQISILKHLNVDLAIIHGGNNSLTESLANGVPVLVLPLFYDQYNNGQRVIETMVGMKMDPFKFEDQQLIDNVESLLNNVQLIQRVKQISERIRASDSKTKCCLRLEKIIEDFEHV